MTRPAIHPGEILTDELGMSAAALARTLHVPPIARPRF
jgi:plasmid maintenance system antidote protein VapI